MSTANNAVSPHRMEETKPPLLALPGELRNEIYRYLLVSPEYDRLEITKPSGLCRLDFGLCSELLTVSRQIYQEAATILYGENRLVYHVSQATLSEIMSLSPTGFPAKNFRLIRDLVVVFYARKNATCPITHDVCRFMDLLRGQACSFKKFGLDCRVSRGGKCRSTSDSTDPIEERKIPTHTFDATPHLVKSICGVDVETEILMSLEVKVCEDDTGTLGASFKNFVYDIGSEKSWIVEELTEYSTVPDSERKSCRYLISARSDPTENSS